MNIKKLQEYQKEYNLLNAAYISSTEVYAFAENLSKEIGLDRIRSSLKELISDYGGSIHNVNFLNPNVPNGSIYIHSSGKFDIILPTYTGPLFDRFAIACELGHFLLHKPEGKKENKCSWGIRLDSIRVNWEANWFAAGFLMPKYEFKKQMEEGAGVSKLAAHFGVSLAAADIRYNHFKKTEELSVGEEKCLSEEILDLFKKRMKMEYDYINPHFMQEITRALYDYYKIEDDEVDKWVIDMFGA